MAGLWIREGTVSVTAGSATVNGSGTDWTRAEAGPRKGHLMLIVAADGSQFIAEVEGVSSATRLTLVTPYPGPTASGLGYAIDSFRANTAADLDQRIALFLDHYQQTMVEWDDRLTQIPDQLTEAQQAANDADQHATRSETAASASAASASEADRFAQAAELARQQASAITGWRVACYAPLVGLAAGEVVAAFVCDQPGRLSRTLSGSQFRLMPPPIGVSVLSLIVNQLPVATINGVDGQPMCHVTPLLDEDVILAPGDVLTITHTYAAGAAALAATLAITH